MPRRLANVVLFALVVGLAASGLLGWLLPFDEATPLFVAHRALGIALVLALTWKVAMARRSLERRLPRGDRSVSIGGVATALFAASVVVGFAWTIGTVSFDSLAGYSALNIHVFLGLALLPATALHLALRREPAPPLGRLLTRRVALRLGALALAALAVTPLLDVLGSLRRPTGSKHAGSFDGNAMPSTIWALDRVPFVDQTSWRLEVASMSFSLGELLSLPRTDTSAVLDCTGGWWSEQRWSGVALAELLARAGASGTAVTVTSITGHGWSFDASDVRDLLVATHLGGETLSAAHGYPARLVAPGRRGFQWVKWLARIDAV